MQRQYLTVTIVSCLIVLQSVICAGDSISGTPSQITELKLKGGSQKCEGLLQIRGTSGSLGQACDLDAGVNEAMVVCRQLGCTAQGATRVDATRYGFSSRIDQYIGFGSSCQGSETNINSCPTPGSRCRADSAEYAVAIRCGGVNSGASIRCGGVNSGASITAGIVHLLTVGLVLLML